MTSNKFRLENIYNGAACSDLSADCPVHRGELFWDFYQEKSMNNTLFTACPKGKPMAVGMTNDINLIS